MTCETRRLIKREAQITKDMVEKEGQRQLAVAKSLGKDIIPNNLRKIATLCDIDEDYNYDEDGEDTRRKNATRKRRKAIRPSSYGISERIENGRARRGKRGSVISESGEWWDPAKPIYYDFDDKIADGLTKHNQSFAKILQRALSTIEENTCFTFIRNKGPSAKILYVDDAKLGCFSPQGKSSKYNEGKYKISLSSAADCWTFSTAVHETFHVLGIAHEMARPDRHEYLLVDDASITNAGGNWAGEFEYYGMIPFKSPFDYGSVMFYSPYDYHKSGKSCEPVMFATDARYQFTMSGEEGPTFYDFKQLNDIYKCSASSLICENGGYTNPKNGQKCNCPSNYAGATCNQLAPSIGLSPNCGGKYSVSNSWTNITADIKGSYDNEHKCIWHFTSPANSRIQLKAKIINIENVTECNHDGYCRDGSLEIKAIKDLSQTGYRFCCDETLTKVGNTFESPSNYLPVILHARQHFKISLVFRAIN
uniref:Metalloendopeptidase n=1 Tax=Plectus sambesii TaxID=2011161 RepID=A0A914X5J0_9BILA